MSSHQPRAGLRRLGSLLPVVVFDTAGPLVVYSLVRSAGHSQVTALVLSGVLPALGVLLLVIRRRRLDVIGIVVLVGIVVGTILGLATGSARLVLLEGSVPTAIFAVACIGSVRSRRPMIFRFALEFMGADTPAGQDFADRWRYPGFRRYFRLVTVVWGTAYLLEAGARVVVVELTSTGTAFAISKVMPYVVTGVLVVWTVIYGRLARRRGERPAAAQSAADQSGQPPAGAETP